MGPETPSIDDPEQLAARIDEVADDLAGHFGAIVAVLDDSGPTVVYERAADKPTNSASVIKLPILHAFYAALDADDLPDPSSSHPLAPENRVGGSGVLAILDGAPTLEDLARAMIAISDNAATNELIDLLGLEAINDAAERLGMVNAHLGRKMMETLEGDGRTPDEPVNTVAPRDCLQFFADFHYERTLSEDAYEAMREPLLKSDSRFGRYLPYETTIVNKTGWVPTASLDAGIVYPDERTPVAFAVVTDDLDHGAYGSDAIANVGDAVYAWLTD